MDAKSLFLTANCDTIYYMGVIKPPRVRWSSAAPLGLEHHQRHVVQLDHRRRFPGPDCGGGGKYLVVPGYTGPLPEGGFYIATPDQPRALRRAFVPGEQRPQSPPQKKTSEEPQALPLHPGGVGTSIATASEGTVRLAVNPPIPETKFIEASGRSNTVPPAISASSDAQRKRPAGAATSYDVELAGQLAAIGIARKPFQPDARMKKILTAAAVGNAPPPQPQLAANVSHPDWAYYPDSKVGQHALPGRSLKPRPGIHPRTCSKPYRHRRRTLDSRTAFCHYAHARLARHASARNTPASAAAKAAKPGALPSSPGFTVSTMSLAGSGFPTAENPSPPPRSTANQTSPPAF